MFRPHPWIGVVWEVGVSPLSLFLAFWWLLSACMFQGFCCDLGFESKISEQTEWWQWDKQTAGGTFSERLRPLHVDMLKAAQEALSGQWCDCHSDWSTRHQKVVMSQNVISNTNNIFHQRDQWKQIRVYALCSISFRLIKINLKVSDARFSRISQLQVKYKMSPT